MGQNQFFGFLRATDQGSIFSWKRDSKLVFKSLQEETFLWILLEAASTRSITEEKTLFAVVPHTHTHTNVFSIFL
jgi:hypothetical protein